MKSQYVYAMLNESQYVYVMLNEKSMYGRYVKWNVNIWTLC